MEFFQADCRRGGGGRKLRAVIGVLAMANVASLLGVAPAAQAVDFPVSCHEESLIDRIEAANLSPGPDRLILAKDCEYKFEEAYFDEGALVLTDNALPVITGDLTIVGRGSKIVREIDEDDAEDEFYSPFRLLEINGPTVEINDVTFAGGLLAFPGVPPSTAVGGLSGGGILNNGNLTLNRVTVRDNEIFLFDATAVTTGGGIASSGPLELNRSTVSGNEITAIGMGSPPGGGDAIGQAGGVNSTGPTVIKRSTIKSNGVTGVGTSTSLMAAGGIAVGGGPASVLDMSSSSVTKNRVDSTTNGTANFAAAGGVLVGQASTANVIDKSYISGNSVEAEGGQLSLAAGGGILNASLGGNNPWGLSVDDPDLGADDDDETRISENRVSCQALCLAVGGGYANDIPSFPGAIGTAEFNHTLFKENTVKADGVGLGGGLYLDGDGVGGTVETALVEATVTKNVVKGHVWRAGGGIYATPDAEVDLDDSRVYKNKPDDCAGAAVFGLCDD